jgi:hypothetical protein
MGGFEPPPEIVRKELHHGSVESEGFKNRRMDSMGAVVRG